MSIKNIILFFLIFTSLCLKAQINVTVGYDLAIKKLEEVNSTIQRYNDETPGLSKKMPQIWNMNGLDLGLRYRIGFIALEGHYLTKFKNAGARQTVADDVLKNSIKLNDQSFSFGTVLYFNKFGLGAAWEKHSFRFSRKFSDDKKYVEAFEETPKYSTLNLYADFYTKLNDNMGFIIRPYYQFELRGNDISANQIEKNLLLNPTVNNNSATKWGFWGVKFIFSNGKQIEKEK
jgi:hypothetical protein